MAPRKRKVVVATAGLSPEKVKYSTVVIQTVLNAQQKETTHAKLINQLKQLYTTVPHDSFMKSFIQVVKRQMEHEETNQYANNVLKFCAKFVAEPEYSEQSNTHPVMASFFNWLLSTISSAQLVRFRICQLVNLILNALGPDATLDDTICDKILRYMLERIRDVSQQVRVQAVLALQRLQDPSNPEDSVLHAYTYHLDKDPSPKVRQTIISSLGRNYRSIPHILDRLWDADQRVRRHTYMQMSSFPVRQYKVAQRIKFLEQGLVDHSDSVRKVVRNVMIPQWVESYQRDYVAFVEALKLDADENEMDRFRKASKMALFEIFSKNGVEEMAALLNFSEENKSVPLAELTIERAICWQAMLEYLQKTNADEEEDYIMELSKFCVYLKELVENPSGAAFMKSASNASSVSNQTSPGQSDVDKLQQLYFQYILLTLLEIVGMYDFGDEFGCDSLKLVLSGILCNETLYEMNVRLIMQTFEKLLTDVETRLKFFVDLVNSVLEPSRADFSHSSRLLVETYLEQHPEQTALKLKISSLRLEILDLKEQENLLVQQKNYAGAQCVSEKLNTCNEEYANLVKPLVHEMTTSIASTTGDSSLAAVFRDSMLKPRRMTLATINKCLQICFYLVNSSTVRVLTPAVCDLYKSFISRHVQSMQLHTRNWALRASTAFSMLYDGLSKDTFQLLYQQFLDTASTRLWKTAIECVFELLDRYGFEHFDLEKDDTEKDTSRTNKSSRQLFNRHSMGYSEETTSSFCNGNEFYKMSIHFMDTCDDAVICSTIIEGFCRLILRGHCTSPDIVSKLLLRFFNPTTDSETQQILGIFFESLIRKKRQEILQKALLRTLFTVLEAPNESPLAEVHPETVVKFVINSTQPIFCAPGVNPHNTIAVTFLRVMQDNLNLKDLLKILGSQLLVLDIEDDAALRSDLANASNEILKEPTLDPKVIKHLTAFRETMLGKIREPLSFSSSRTPVLTAAVDEQADDDEHHLVDNSAGGAASNEKELEAVEEDEDDDEQEQEQEEEDEQENRANERPQINKSILQEDSDVDLLSSPLRTRSDVTVSSRATSTTPPPAEGDSSIKSLRRSSCFVSRTSLEQEQRRTSTIATDELFKVPDASALRKTRVAPARAKLTPSVVIAPLHSVSSNAAVESKRLGESFEIPASQYEDNLSGNSDADSDLEIPETQSTPHAPSNPRRSRRTNSRSRRASKGKNEPIPDSSSSSSRSSSTSEGDVVNGSPNVTVSRINRSVRPLNKMAAKTLYEQKVNATPGTLPRGTRHSSRLDATKGKVMTRRSLVELSGTSPIRTTKPSSRPYNNNEQNYISERFTTDKESIPSKQITRSANQATKKTTKKSNMSSNSAKQSEQVSSPDRRSSSRRSKQLRNRSTVPATSTPHLPKTSTRTSARKAANEVQEITISSPGSKRQRVRSSGIVSSNDSATSTTSPIRLKRAAVVLTPLSAVRFPRQAGLDSSTTKAQTPATSPRRPNRKATRK